MQWEFDAIVPAKLHASLAEAIAAAIQTMLAMGHAEIGDTKPLPLGLGPYVAAIYLYPPDAGQQGPRVRTSQEAWTGTGSPDVIQQALDDKERKLAAYRRARPGTDVWLLLWTSAGEAQPVNPDLLDGAHIYRSGFDRAFVLDYPRRSVVELTLARREQAPAAPER